MSLGAFALYRATLLPGLDFGDTASFQVVVGLPLISTRDAYPLYFAIADIVFRILGGDRAHLLNLVSAIESAIACGILVLVGAELSGSLLAGSAAALVFAGSYTFWSQSVIAEVYGLHILCVALTIWLLLRWESRPTLPRLAAFFGVYAFAFGNHLSMILLAPAYTVFLLISAPGGWRSLFTPRVVALATAFAAAGALQYAWNLRTLWYTDFPPHGILEAIRGGWFDITKGDWRATMVLNVPRTLLKDHAAMYAFDLRQQFGWIGIATAVVGLFALSIQRWRRGVLLAAAYIANVLFAYSYNVGDTHVFYLPAHLVVALLTAPAVAFIMPRKEYRPFFAALLLSYAATRIYHDYPALDRSGDRRPTEVLDRITAGIDDRHAILLTDLNWQVQNGLNYYARWSRPEVAFTRVADVLLYAPAFVRDNATIGRNVMLTDRARDAIGTAYGPFFATMKDDQVRTSTLADISRELAPGTRYVLCVLKPTREFTVDQADVTRSLAILTGASPPSWPIPSADYVAIAGEIGHPPDVVAAADVPFRRTTQLEGTRVEVRMDAWLAADTIRRMGFGHVVAGHRHTLIVERGVSFVAFDPTGRPIRSAYFANLFAAQPRYITAFNGSRVQ